MLIGITHPAFDAIGGAEILIARYASFLRDAGHRVRIVTEKFDHQRWSGLAAIADIRVEPRRRFDSIGLPFTYPKLGRRARRHARAIEEADVVLGGNFPGNVVASNVRNGSSSIWTCMEPTHRLHPKEVLPTLYARTEAPPREDDPGAVHFERREFQKSAMIMARGGEVPSQRRADLEAVARLARIIAISGFSAANVRKIYGRTPDAVMYPTVTDPGMPMRATGMSPTGLRVLSHARLWITKNFDTVIRGFAQFAAQNPGRHELHIVGTGSDGPRLEQVVRQLDLGESVRFHGFLPADKLAEVYAHCDVMALLPIDEPFGMVFPEAAMRGLLIIGPDHGGPVEILEAGRLGWNVDAFTPEPLAHALEEAWRLPDAEVKARREKAADACRRRYAASATLPTLLSHVEALAAKK